MFDRFNLADDDVHEDASNYHFAILARGSQNTDPEDACDPIRTTYVLQTREHTFLRAIKHAINENTSIESQLEEYIRGNFEPQAHCWCSHDCCGCRTGHLKIKHLGGGTFMAQSITARNY